jgi:hypothetical protein
VLSQSTGAQGLSGAEHEVYRIVRVGTAEVYRCRRSGFIAGVIGEYHRCYWHMCIPKGSCQYLLLLGLRIINANAELMSVWPWIPQVLPFCIADMA